MPRNDFHSDDRWQRRVRDAILVPQFYQARTAGRFVLMDKGRLADFLQRRMAVDTVVQGKNGEAVSIEEKIVRWPGYTYTAYCLETESCTVPGHESPGWMQYGDADYLLYCFQQADESLACDLIPFPQLRDWFWPLADTFPVFQMTTRNRTRGRKVPIAVVKENMPVASFRLPVPERAAA
jgi:hypothetical protein